jgi:cytochrome c oxidase subunit 2
MALSTGVFRRVRPFAAAVLTLTLLVLVGCTTNEASYPQTTLAPKSDFTTLVDDVFQTTFLWAVIVFVLVEAALLFAMWKFRGRPGDAEPAQVHGNATLEVVWTIIPAFILAIIAVPTVQTIFRTSATPTEPEVEVEVIGHQWWWEYRYPALGVVTANELHVPVGKTVALKMWSADVLHSFWSPQLAAKRDVFPQGPRFTKINPLWFRADTTGDFTGQCAEFCGIQHARMGLRVIVQTEAEFLAWVERQRAGSPLVNGGVVAPPVDSAGVPVPDDSLMVQGRQLFQAAGCIACHAMVGTPLAGTTALLGPNLSHFGSRTSLGANMYPNTDENLARWLRDPQAMKEKSLMVLPRPLTEDEISTLVAYLRAHQ